MPELAEVEIVRRNLTEWWNSAADEVRLHDDTLLKRGAPELLDELLRSDPPEMDRRGKYLIARFDDRAIVFHFRMTGKIIRSGDPEPDYARLAWNAAGTDWLVFRDSRRLGHIEVFETGELDEYGPLQRMGPEPYDLSGEKLSDVLPPRRRLKDALMDQSVVAGVGNIAISEIFWRLELGPSIKSNELTDDQVDALAAELPAYFDDIIEREMADEVVYVEEDSSENPFDVYGREGEECPRCGTAIERAKIGGRSTYYCPACQGDP